MRIKLRILCAMLNIAAWVVLFSIERHINEKLDRVMELIRNKSR